MGVEARLLQPSIGTLWKVHNGGLRAARAEAAEECAVLPQLVDNRRRGDVCPPRLTVLIAPVRHRVVPRVGISDLVLRVRISRPRPVAQRVAYVKEVNRMLPVYDDAS